jgi:hypothetical protein
MPSPLLTAEILAVYILGAFVAGFMGRRRRIGFWGFVFLSLLVTPIFTTIFIFCAAPAKPRLRRTAR